MSGIKWSKLVSEEQAYSIKQLNVPIEGTCAGLAFTISRKAAVAVSPLCGTRLIPDTLSCHFRITFNLQDE